MGLRLCRLWIGLPLLALCLAGSARGQETLSLRDGRQVTDVTRVEHEGLQVTLHTTSGIIRIDARLLTAADRKRFGMNDEELKKLAEAQKQQREQAAQQPTPPAPPPGAATRPAVGAAPARLAVNRAFMAEKVTAALDTRLAAISDAAQDWRKLDREADRSRKKLAESRETAPFVGYYRQVSAFAGTHLKRFDAMAAVVKAEQSRVGSSATDEQVQAVYTEYFGPPPTVAQYPRGITNSPAEQPQVLPAADARLQARLPQALPADVTPEGNAARYAGAELVAADGKKLGTISGPLHADSIFNVAGRHGSDDGTLSIWNASGPYGGGKGVNSPFNPDAKDPPRLLKNGRSLGHLSVSRELTDAVNPFELADAYLGGGADQ